MIFNVGTMLNCYFYIKTQIYNKYLYQYIMLNKILNYEIIIFKNTLIFDNKYYVKLWLNYKITIIIHR